MAGRGGIMPWMVLIVDNYTMLYTPGQEGKRKRGGAGCDVVPSLRALSDGSNEC